jgi:site-specific recombinase XerC
MTTRESRSEETWIGIPSDWSHTGRLPDTPLTGPSTPLDTAILHVVAELKRRAYEVSGEEAIKERTAIQYSTTLNRVGKYVKAEVGSIPVEALTRELIERFMYAPGIDGTRPQPKTSQFRLSVFRFAARYLLEHSCLRVDPTRGLRAPRAGARIHLRLSEAEFQAAREASCSTLAETRLPTVIAIAEGGAVSTEIGEARVCDLDLSNLRIWLSGCHTALPRWARLSPWGAGADRASR